MIKKIFKYLGIVILALLGILFIVYLMVNEPLPKGEQGAQAEQLADEMLAALNKSAYDSLDYIAFTFVGAHNYEWDRKNKKVTVKWDDNVVLLDLTIGPESYDKLQNTAYEFFINDSFWLVAPYKVRDGGVIRAVVDVEEGRGLLVTYTSGGVTPGDSYLWILDEKGLPKSWKLWTSILPIGGVEFTWEGWQRFNGAQLPTLHKSDLFDIPMTEIEVR